MPKPEKVQLVRQFKDKLQRAKGFVVTTYTGIDAGQMTALRRRLKSEGVELTVIKNRLFARALQEVGFNGDLVQRLKGPLAIVLGYHDAIAAPKIIHQLKRDYEALSLLWGVIEGRVYDTAQLEAIATLPSREELMAQVIGYVLSPVYSLMGTINAVLWEFAAVLDAVIEKQSAVGLNQEQGGSFMAATSKVGELFEALKGLTLLELKQLVDLFKEEFGVTAVAPVAAAPSPAAPPAEAAPAVEEKTEFKVILKTVPPPDDPEKRRLQVIKTIREVIPGVGLGEAKNLVDSAPSVVREGISKDEAQKIKEKLEAVGATVEIE